MQRPERIFNWLFGGSVICWAAFAMFDPAVDRPVVIRLSVAGLHLFVGLLILFRFPVRKQGAIKLVAMAVPAVLLGGWAFYFSDTWSVWAQAILLCGTGIAIASLASLGRNFSVLPAKRSIVRGGLYRIVRHPVYAGELIMLFGCAISSPFPIGMIVYVCIVVCVMVRISAEEELLQTDGAYQAYASKVSWRLIPYLW